VPRDAVQESDLPVRLPECLLRPLLLCDVLNDPVEILDIPVLVPHCNGRDPGPETLPVLPLQAQFPAKDPTLPDELVRESHPLRRVLVHLGRA